MKPKNLWFWGVFIAAAAALVFFWRLALVGGFYAEDSWFFFDRSISFVDLLNWVFSPHDFIGYYRPVRRMFLALYSILAAPEFSPELAAAASVLLYLSLFSAVFFLYRNVLKNIWVALGMAMAFALSPYIGKSILWLSASHNLFAGIFSALSILLLLKEMRALCVLFFALAVMSRETALGLVLPLCWLEYQNNDARLNKDFFRRITPIFILSLFFSVIFIYSAPPNYVSDGIPRFFPGPDFIQAWLAYTAIYFWPKIGLSINILSHAWLIGAFAGALLFLLFLFGFKNYRAHKKELFFFWLWIGGLSIHLIKFDVWNFEYVLISSIGFFGLIGVAIEKHIKRAWTLLAIAIAMPLGAAWISSGYADSFQKIYKEPWPIVEAWTFNLKKHLASIPDGAVVVISDSETLKEEYNQVNSVFLTGYVSLRMPERVIYWDNENFPMLNKGFRVRYFRHPRFNIWAEGQEIFYLEERDLVWRTAKQEKMPALNHKL